MKFPRPTRPIVAEELDADWSQMRAEFAPANAKLYNNLAFGPMQGTGGSTSVANSWDQLRSAAAASRAMLVAAAAEDWKVPASEITVHKGRLSHRSGKSGSFGQFAEKAAHLPLPGDVPLKDPAKFGLIGAKMPRINSTEKTTGKAIYAQDIRRPGMLTAVIARSAALWRNRQFLRCKRRQGRQGRRRRDRNPSGRRGAGRKYMGRHPGS